MRTAILLRAINLAGTNKISMAALKDLLQRNGYEDVATYLQSGNAVASGDVSSKNIEKLIEAEFGHRIDVITRSHAELEKIVAGNPFPEHAGEGSRLAVGFCDKAPSVNIDKDAYPPDEILVKGKDVYLWFPGGMGRSKLSLAFPKKLGVISTVRNWNSVLKLAELTGTLGR
ncbi:MAG TPA: DUF1697 domain-containing protein [Candidatus Limnocylindrales bacterium]|nr:DUF1697 domain-containing protein [Candidatus Limnocylindrales bacterium]